MSKLDTSIAFSYNISEEKVIEFINYRKEIKKPLKTQRGLKQNLEQAFKCSQELPVSAEQAIDITMGEEWQGVKVGYVKRHLLDTGVIKNEAYQQHYQKRESAIERVMRQTSEIHQDYSSHI